MITVVEEPPVETVPESSTHGPDERVLTDKVPEHWRAPRVLAGMALVLGVIYAFFCARPIWHTDVWGHLSYGRYIWETKSLPVTEPLLPLAKGMPFVDSAWLSQLIGYAVVSSPRLKLSGLQGLFALAITGCCALLSWRAYQQTRNGWFTLLAVAGFLFVGSIPLTILRPQLAGTVCFVFLLTRLTARRPHPSDWIVIPGLFAVWANLHASFPVGLGLLTFFCLGRAIDLFRKTGSLGKSLSDRQVVRLFLITQLSAAAVLLNPYTIGLYAELLRFSANENLLDLSEWHPLTLRDEQGQLFAITAILLAVIYRNSPRRVRAWESLTLIAFGLAAMWNSRMIVWWAPVVGLLIAQHGFAIWRKWTRSPLVAEPAERTGKWSLVSVGLVWIFFMISPLGIAIVHGKHTDPTRAVSSYTPRFAAEYLNEHPPQGLVFNTYEWGDYLQWAGPRGMKLFVNSHAHLVPREVWMAYMQVIEMRSGWEETLDRYGVNTIVVDRLSREPLIKKLKEDDRWKAPPEERDGQVIFLRKKPIGVPTPNSTAGKPADELNPDQAESDTH